MSRNRTFCSNFVRNHHHRKCYRPDNPLQHLLCRNTVSKANRIPGSDKGCVPCPCLLWSGVQDFQEGDVTARAVHAHVLQWSFNT